MNKCMNCGYEGNVDCCPKCNHYMIYVHKSDKTKVSVESKASSVSNINVIKNTSDSKSVQSSSYSTVEENKGINQCTNNTESVKEDSTTNKVEEVHNNSSDANTNKYNAQKSLKFSIDVLMTLVKITTIIITICVVLELISSIICFTSDSTRTLGAQLLGVSIVLAIYGAFRYYVIYRVREANYKYNIADVVLTMFLSLPCAILMMVYKGYE